MALVYKFGVTLTKNSNLGVVNLFALFMVRQNLKIGFGCFGFEFFGTYTCVAFQMLALQLLITVCFF